MDGSGEFDVKLPLSAQWGLAPALRAFFRKRANPQESEDLVQEVFMRLHARAATTPVGNPRSYIFQVATTVLIDNARRKVTRRDAAHQELTEALHPREEISPERTLLARERVNLALKALHGLPERTRQAFMLIRFESLSYAEAARHMGISVSGVEKHMIRAMERIAIAVRDAAEGSGGVDE